MAISRNQPCPCKSGFRYKQCCGKIGVPAGNQSSQRLASIRICDDLSVIVPDSLELLSPYILREQENWFEAEIPFLRRLVRPGMSVVDIGANYGVYTLLLARLVGSAGRLWAFEPASFVASCLAKSTAQNNCPHVKVINAALSNHSGTAMLSLNDNSEWNSLTQDFGGQSEAVRTTTLDECSAEFGWTAIDFVKLDAEGAESDILRGGERFFASESPLVMFEVKHLESWNLELVRQFADAGYESYQLVPGLELLVRAEPARQLDPYQLNFFCCKHDRAQALQDAGLLVGAPVAGHEVEKLEFPRWREILLERPFARNLPGAGATECFNRESGDYFRALELYCLARSPDRPPAQRYGALVHACGLLESAIGESVDNVAWLSTFSRVLGDLGRRDRQVKILDTILSELSRRRQIPELAALFLPPCARFENIDGARDLTNWFAAAALEELEIKCAYSSYFSGTKALQRLELIRNLGFQSAEMERRRQMVRMRFGLQKGPDISPLLVEAGAQNRNPEFWRA